MQRFGIVLHSLRAHPVHSQKLLSLDLLHCLVALSVLVDQRRRAEPVHDQGRLVAVLLLECPVVVLHDQKYRPDVINQLEARVKKYGEHRGVPPHPVPYILGNVYRRVEHGSEEVSEEENPKRPSQVLLLLAELLKEQFLRDSDKSDRLNCQDNRDDHQFGWENEIIVVVCLHKPTDEDLG